MFGVCNIISLFMGVLHQAPSAGYHLHDHLLQSCWVIIFATFEQQLREACHPLPEIDCLLWVLCPNHADLLGKMTLPYRPSPSVYHYCKFRLSSYCSTTFRGATYIHKMLLTVSNKSVTWNWILTSCLLCFRRLLMFHKMRILWKHWIKCFKTCLFKTQNRLPHSQLIVVNNTNNMGVML